MAKYYGRKGSGRGKSSTGGSTYMRANNESISVLRLYKDEVANSVSLTTVKSILTAAGFLTATGFPTKALKIRLIAVGWSANDTVGSAANQGGTTLEFLGDGNSFNISNRSIKPVRTRVPQKDYIDGQWFSVNSGAELTDSTVVGTIGDVTAATALFSCDGLVNFVDIAVRY